MINTLDFTMSRIPPSFSSTNFARHFAKLTENSKKLRGNTTQASRRFNVSTSRRVPVLPGSPNPGEGD
jgi:hypothetical protein